MSITFKDVPLGSLFWLIISPILFLIVALFGTWKLVVILLAKCMRKDLKPMKGYDSMLAPGPGHVYSMTNFGLICHLDGIIEVDDLRSLIQEKLLGHEKDNSEKPMYERLHCSIETFGGYAFYKRLNNVDINELISEQTCKGNEGDQALEDLLSDWVLTKYQKDRPCWEVTVIPRKSMNQTVIALRIHHALADGYSLLYILDQLTGNTSPYLVKDFNDTLSDKISQIMALPMMMRKFMKDFPSGPNPLPCTPENIGRWKLAFTRMDVAPLKLIRQQYNVQFSSIILTAIAGALKTYIVNDMKRTDLPPVMPMATTLPWPRHPSKNSESPTNDRICNHWATSMFPVPIESTPEERLLKTDATLKEYQEFGIHKVMRAFFPLIGLLPCSLGRAMNSKDPGIAAGYTATLAGDNYVLLQKPVVKIYNYLAIPDVMPSCPVSTFAFSHSGHFEFTFAYNPQHFPERSSVDKILNDYLPAEIALLLNAKKDE